MAIQIRTGYINPLNMMADKTAVRKSGQPAARRAKQADKAAELQVKRQQLQNQMLLLKATGTDSAGASTEAQKAVAEALEKVTAELRSVGQNGVQGAEHGKQPSLKMQSAARIVKDLYEPAEADAASPGIYQVEKDKEGYKISFLPCKEA